ncbi:hypothetical protein HAX54_047085, partial [Datura stramonium]|nr:hypothetical protein [Datura stramonium]
MALNVNKRKVVASSSHGNKWSRGSQEAPMEDASMPQPPPRRYGIRWVTKKEVLNRLLGTPSIDPHPFKYLILRPP